MSRRCATVSDAILTIETLAELEAFTQMILHPPSGVVTKQPTKSEWREIAQLKIRMQKRGGRR